MAPAIPNQKRKRGGPAVSPIAAHDATQRATRSRRTNQEAEVTADDQPAERTKSSEIAKSATRGRPRKGESKMAGETTEPATDGVRRSKRDRRSADDNPWWISGHDGVEELEAEAEEGPVRPTKRARTSQGLVTAESKKQAARARTEESTPLHTATTKQQRRPRAREGPSETSSAETEIRPKQRGRPRKSDMSSAGAPEPPAHMELQPKKRGRPRPSNASSTAGAPSKSPKTKSSAAAPRHPRNTITEKRRESAASQRRKSTNQSSQEASQSVAEMDDELQASIPPVPKYRHIEPRTRLIPRSTISAKWLPLDDASVDAVSSIITDASRPVLLRLRDRDRRHQQGQTILRIFAGRLRSKLRKGMPFPPPTAKVAGTRGSKADASGGHVDELNFESTVDSIESLETALDPLLHSVALLEQEKAKEEAALEREYETLRTLEANARAEARGWRERVKKAHALVSEPRTQDVSDADRANEEALALVKRKSTVPNGVFYDVNDEGLLSMSQQLANHMESIQKNLQPLQEVFPAMEKSRAALQSVLQTHLAPQQFERVLLG